MRDIDVRGFMPTILPELMAISGTRIPSGPPLPPDQLKAAMCLHLGASDGLAAFNQLTAGPQDLGESDRTMLASLSAGTSPFPQFAAPQEAPMNGPVAPWMDGVGYILGQSAFLTSQDPARVGALRRYLCELPRSMQPPGSLFDYGAQAATDAEPMSLQATPVTLGPGFATMPVFADPAHVSVTDEPVYPDGAYL